MSEAITYRQALKSALREEMARDPAVFLMGEEVGLFGGAYKVSDGLLEEFGPQRIIDTPISEEGFVGAGIGAAMLGQRPVVEIMTINFSLVALDQIVNHAAKIGTMFAGQVRCPLVIRMPNGGGNQLTAQHSQSFDAWFAHTPGLKVVAPANPADAKGLLKTAIRDDDPVIFIENLPIYKEKGIVPTSEDHTVPLGQADVTRSGTDLSIISAGYSTVRALTAAETLADKDKIEVEIIDLRCLRPLDSQTISKSVEKTNRALIVEEGWPSYGIGAEIAARLQKSSFDYLDAPIERVGSAEVPLPYAKNLEDAALPSEDKIIRATRQLLS